MLKADGFDDCVLGLVDGVDLEPRICYSREAVITKLMETMTEEEAVEHFEFNVVGSYLGAGMPVFLQPMSMDDINLFAEFVDGKG